MWTTVVFDLGGVLIDWNPRFLYRRLFDDPVQMEHFLAQVCTPAWNLELDGGASMDVAISALQRAHPEHAAAIAAWRDRWPEMLGGAISGTVEILEELHAAGVPLFALTNWSRHTWPHARDRFGFLERFDAILVSGDERMRKPDPRFYRLLEQRCGVDLASSVFIDDHPANVEGARALGMAAVRFTTPGALRGELRGLGLPV